MMVVIAYDVDTQNADGRRRLRRIAKQCLNYGQRVQNSVFECLVDATQYKELQYKLCAIMDPKRDSLCVYHLGDRYRSRIEHFGVKTVRDLEEPLIL